MNVFFYMLNKVAVRLGFVCTQEVKQKLDYGFSVAKRLDEHRELVEAIHAESVMLDKWWHIRHLATQDDYLMRLFFMVHECWPEEVDGHWPAEGIPVRPRPQILGACGLPEYKQEN